MKWSWRIGRLFGIDIYLHTTFLVLLAAVGLIAMYQGGPYAAARQVGAIVLLFAIVVLHELGHALAARQVGIGTRQILLLPIGGVAQIEGMPEDPLEEIWVAVAGPLVNVILAVLASLALLAGTYLARLGYVVPGVEVLQFLLYANLALLLFNLLPAFPMDGGRVLRALLALFVPLPLATTVAATLGRIMAVLFAIAGFYYTPMLLLVAVFIWIGGGKEAAAVILRDRLRRVTLRDVMATNFTVLSPQEPLATARTYVWAGAGGDFPVFAAGRLVGVLTRHRLELALQQLGTAVPVGHVMEQDFLTAEADESLEAIVSRMRETACPIVPVLGDGRVLGLVSLERLGQYLAAKAGR